MSALMTMTFPLASYAESIAFIHSGVSIGGRCASRSTTFLRGEFSDTLEILMMPLDEEHVETFARLQ